MSVNLSPIGDDASFIDASGNPLNAGLLYTYTAGSTTPQNTYTTSAGSVANANPIVLDSNGYPSNGSSVVSIWLTGGVSYKFVLKTSAGVTVWTRDNISGINDTTVSVSEWVSGPAPTYVSATSFTLVGDQTSTFTIGRRLKTTNSGGTVYSRISNSVFGAATTVTVVNDSGTLDAGLSAVSYGLLSSINQSMPPLVGTVTNDSAVAGGVGEYMEQILPRASGAALSTGVAKSCASITLTAGDWDVFGALGIDSAATTNFTYISGSFSAVNNTDGAAEFQIITQYPAAGVVPVTAQRFAMPQCRFKVAASSTQVVYLVANVNFSVAAAAGYGMIAARRRR